MVTKKDLRIENEELKARIRALEEKNDFFWDENNAYKANNDLLNERLSVVGERLANFSLELTRNREYIEELENEIAELKKYKEMYDAEENIARDIISSVKKNSGAFEYSLNDLFNGDVLEFLNGVLNSYKK